MSQLSRGDMSPGKKPVSPILAHRFRPDGDASHRVRQAPPACGAGLCKFTAMATMASIWHFDIGDASEGKMSISESQTRDPYIDPQLSAADWKHKDHTQVQLEVPVDGYDGHLAPSQTRYRHQGQMKC